DIDARNKVSDSMNVDLISYSKGNVDKERYLLMRQVLDAKKLLGDRYNPEISKRRVEDAVKGMESRQKEANKEKRWFMARQALVDGVIGAAVGGGAGIIAAKARELISKPNDVKSGGEEPAPSGGVGTGKNLTPEDIRDNQGGIRRGHSFNEDGLYGPERDLPRNAELAVDKDGGYTVRINGKDVIGSGDEPGIEFTDRGLPTAESIERLKAAGIEIESTPEQIPLPGATKQVGINDFFNKENVGNEGLSRIAGRQWIVNNDGSPLYNTGNIHVGDNGDIIMQVTRNPGSDSLEGMKYFFTGNSANQSVGIFVDVQPDGTVVIPAGSPAASLFDGDKYLGVYAELTRQGADGKIEVFNTFGNGIADIDTITVPNPGAFDTVYTHVLKVDGQSLELNVPNSVNAESTLTNLIGHGSLKGTGEPIGYKATGGITELKTNSGEVVSVDHVEHYGGYDEAHDTFFHPDKYLDGANNSGASVVREMVGAEGEGLSSGEIDRIFMEKVNSGKIAEGDVIEKYLENVAKSPESLVTTRAMMGGLRVDDIDGDGIPDLIDTEAEINLFADIISRDPDGYDAFANDTLNMFYDKIAGGTIRFVDYSKEQFQYSTWAKYIGDNVMQRLGMINHPTNGVGI
ncbi:MAG: hypothetical protein Q4F61_00615, partial [Candidatus Saccharibacteria bacterium]|nr:hypothetical protein [Candidatus Saccharibacteria bacterium]